MTDLNIQRKKSGATTLFMTLILLLLSTMIIIFAAKYGQLQNKSISNINRNNQAFEAAQAGLEYGVNYLNKMSYTILSSPVSGYIRPYSDSNTNDVALANNSRYTITYTNPVAFDYELIKISSTGVSDDSSSTRTVSQLIKFGSKLLSVPTIPLTSKGSVSLANNSEISNQFNNTTIDSASTVTLTGSAQTVLSSGVSSTAGNNQSDITENNTPLNDLSIPDYFTGYFGISADMLKGSVGSLYSNNTDTSYRTQLSGQQGTSIWIDQTGGTATVNGFSIVGSPSQPVLLIINGASELTGFVIIYGFVFIDGAVSVAASANIYIYGGIANTGNLSGAGSLRIYYSPTILSNLQNQSGMRYYSKIPGSWKDF